MEIKVKSSKELKSLLDGLGLEIVDANIYYRLYCNLIDSIEEHKKEFSQSNTFWSLTLSGLQDAYFLRLCRVYDQENKSLNLVNLLDTVKLNLHYFEEPHFRERLKDNAFVELLAKDVRIPSTAQLDEDIVFVRDKNPLVKKLIIWRNNVIAHKGVKVSLGKKAILKNNPLDQDEIEMLLDRGVSIFNRYSSLFQASTWSCQIIGHDDYKSLLHFVGLGLKKREEKIEAELEILRKNQKLN